MKTWLIIAAALILVGLLLFVCVFAANSWDIRAFSTKKFTTNTYEITDGFENISIAARSADVRVLPATDGICKVVSTEHEKYPIAITADGTTLSIEVNGPEKWYEHIGISFDSPQITLYLPSGYYGDLKIDTSTGDILIQSLAAKKMELRCSTADVFMDTVVCQEDICISTTTGDVTMVNVSCRDVKLEGRTSDVSMSTLQAAGNVSVWISTGEAEFHRCNAADLSVRTSSGDVGMAHVVASGKLTVTTSTGDFEFESCDAAEAEIQTSTGDVEGSFRTEKIFVVETSTGEVRVPSSTSGGICRITTGTGDIEITIE